jgi:hypothetical protein
MGQIVDHLGQETVLIVVAAGVRVSSIRAWQGRIEASRCDAQYARFDRRGFGQRSLL